MSRQGVKNQSENRETRAGGSIEKERRLCLNELKRKRQLNERTDTK
jgi:hypothetical protein